jgi:hypothetical protein
MVWVYVEISPREDRLLTSIERTILSHHCAQPLTPLFSAAAMNIGE